MASAESHHLSQDPLRAEPVGEEHGQLGSTPCPFETRRLCCHHGPSVPANAVSATVSTSTSTGVAASSSARAAASWGEVAATSAGVAASWGEVAATSADIGG